MKTSKTHLHFYAACSGCSLSTIDLFQVISSNILYIDTNILLRGTDDNYFTLVFYKSV